MKPLPPFCLWEEYQRTGEYRDMLRWLKHRAYCYATEPEWDEVAPRLLEALACFQPGDAEILRLMRNYLAAHKPDGHLLENGPSTACGVDCMARLLKAAEIMEGLE